MSSSNNPLTGVNHFISLGTAVNMTSKYRDEKENILLPQYRNQNVLLISETFDRGAFDALLAQEGCAGIRIYFGMESGVQVRSLFVGVNAANEDMLPADLETLSDDNHIVEVGQPCPVLCPPPSPLNP